jgi:D-alanyl-D-alanine carboxypeptidase
METSKDLETHIKNAASALTKSMIGINAGGVILLGSLLNALLHNSVN